MSKNPSLSPETKREIDIGRCVQELRSGKWRQIKGDFNDGLDGRCAMGVMMEALGGDTSRITQDRLGYLIPRSVWRAIVRDNNWMNLTLPEIGDKLERGEYSKSKCLS